MKDYLAKNLSDLPTKIGKIYDVGDYNQNSEQIKLKPIHLKKQPKIEKHRKKKKDTSSEDQ